MKLMKVVSDERLQVWGCPSIIHEARVFDLSDDPKRGFRQLSEPGNVLPLWITVAAGLTLAAKQVSGNDLGT
jgi:hypothetical protein